jgi:iodotyrosine deiodinase
MSKKWCETVQRREEFVAKKKDIPLQHYQKPEETVMQERALEFRKLMQERRSVRTFSPEAVPMDVIRDCIRTAGSAPSGANMQPWHFAVVTDPAIKSKIREGAEREERKFYEERASKEWLEALTPLGTDPSKPFLEEAPCLICIFMQKRGVKADGTRVKHYYVQESVGIATGMLIAAVHTAGLVALTHTPSPMNFLSGILGRPDYERPFLILVVGYPAEGTCVPDLRKKTLDDIATFF